MNRFTSVQLIRSSRSFVNAVAACLVFISAEVVVKRAPLDLQVQYLH